jgi:hypothetical protein
MGFCAHYLYNSWQVYYGEYNRMSNKKAALQGEKLIAMSIRWLQSLIEQIDQLRDPYTSRNVAILKLITQHLKENTERNVGAEGARPTKVNTSPSTKAVLLPPSTTQRIDIND